MPVSSASTPPVSTTRGRPPPAWITEAAHPCSPDVVSGATTAATRELASLMTLDPAHLQQQARYRSRNPLSFDT